MIRLVTCSQCGGFLALALHACPHCDAPLDRLKAAALGLAAIAGGGAVSMTLMACYGGACMNGRCADYDSDASADASRDVNVADATVDDDDGRDAGDAGDASGGDAGDAGDASDDADAADPDAG